MAFFLINCLKWRRKLLTMFPYFLVAIFDKNSVDAWVYVDIWQDFPATDLQIAAMLASTKTCLLRKLDIQANTDFTCQGKLLYPRHIRTNKLVKKLNFSRKTRSNTKRCQVGVSKSNLPRIDQSLLFIYTSKHHLSKKTCSLHTYVQINLCRYLNLSRITGK